MRLSKACLVCRSRKQKCQVKDENPTCCLYCEYRSLSCSFLTDPSRITRPRHSPRATTVPTLAEAAKGVEPQFAKDSDADMPPHEVCLDLIDLYFSTMHNTHHALFHRPTFLEDFKEGKVPRLILLATFALISRFSNHVYFAGIDRGARGKKWSQAAKSMLNVQAMDVSICTLQACQLLGCVSMAEGDAAVEAICSAIANRVIQLLGLPTYLSANPLQRELELRVFWSIYMMDMWTATGNSIPRTFSLDNSWLWPMDELCFDQLDGHSHRLDKGTLDKNCPLRRFSLWGLMIPLTDLKGQIHDLNVRFSGASYIDDGALSESVSELSLELDKWTSSLPAHMQDNPINLSLFAARGLCRSFIALHIGYHYCAILLYFRFLYVNFRLDSTGQADLYAQRCKFHATAISEDLWAGYHDYDSECSWPLISHLLVISSSVHLHTLLLESDREMVAHARLLLQQNFLLLTKLKNVWPWVAGSMARLKAFHESCLQTLKTEDAFRMDDWMMKFLHDHSLAVAESRPIHSPLLFEFENW